MKGSDVKPIDRFFGRLVLAGCGSKTEIENEWFLEDCIKMHQQLDERAETERIAYEMNRPKQR